MMMAADHACSAETATRIRGGYREMNSCRARLLLADDHRMFRQGLKTLLEEKGFEIVAEAEDGLHAVAQAQQLHPEVAVLDVSMPLLDGLGAARKIMETSDTQVVLLTAFEEDAYVLNALQEGIRGYVLKAQAAVDLVDAINDVVRGKLYVSPGIPRAVIDAYNGKSKLPSKTITAREVEVLRLIAEGKSTKETAKTLGISVKTAESHRSHIMQKLEIHETASLVRYAIRSGLVQA